MNKSGGKATLHTSKSRPGAAGRILSDQEIGAIADLRSELQLAAHLYRDEIRERWEHAESQWHQLQRKRQPLHDAAGKSRLEIGSAVGLFAETVHNAYRELAEAVAGQHESRSERK